MDHILLLISDAKMHPLYRLYHQQALSMTKIPLQLLDLTTKMTGTQTDRSSERFSPEVCSDTKTLIPGIRNTVMNIRWSCGHLIIIVGIPALVRWYLNIETAPSYTLPLPIVTSITKYFIPPYAYFSASFQLACPKESLRQHYWFHSDGIKWRELD